MMATDTPKLGESGSESIRSMGASSNVSLAGLQQQCWNKFIHHQAVNAASQNMTQDADLKIVCKTGRCKHQKKDAIGCEYIHITVNGHQLNV